AFVDTGAWAALALTRDPLHERAKAIWTDHEASGTRWSTSVPVLIETFTFLSRAVDVDLAIRWKDSLRVIDRFRILECSARDLEDAWTYFGRRDLHRLSAVDASSFVVMTREGLKWAFTFDTHFSVAGFEFLA
ncbi:MAG: PIN domain-containing protein, partial [Chloroflexi bacterium]|nr:PIN domain-containing protein [Chloroflexota bacterium]